jgi:hypothetical protein
MAKYSFRYPSSGTHIPKDLILNAVKSSIEAKMFLFLEATESSRHNTTEAQDYALRILIRKRLGSGEELEEGRGGLKKRRAGGSKA